MALLTADDVLNKKFQSTKFREGYDQDEVDDFLDEVVATLRDLQGENDDLAAKLTAAERRIAELSREPMVDVPAPVVAAPEPAYTPPPVPVMPENAPESATGMLALAQKLHDDYITSGKEESDRLVADARVRADKIVADAEETSKRTISALEQERSLLERKIDELRVFERDYRTRLKSYLENLLGDLDSRASTMPARSETSI
ncbi:MAG: DivIVA domain-containing protein [Micrococcales bacterium]|nr:DivIVA domain-containing protein [Micrococcales bacterium]